MTKLILLPVWVKMQEVVVLCHAAMNSGSTIVGLFCSQEVTRSVEVFDGWVDQDS